MSGIIKVAEAFHSKTEAWDLKAYVLGALFYRHLSEDLVSFVNAEELRAGVQSFDYATIDDDTAGRIREEIVDEKGYFLLPSQLFGTVQSAASDDLNLNETLKAVFSAIDSSAIGTRSEHAFKGLFDSFDPNASALGDSVIDRNKRLAKLLVAIDAHPVTDAAADFDELLRYYVTTAGKKGGDHFTPPTVADLVAELAVAANPAALKVYDPAFGSGSLLIKTRDLLDTDVELLGQELVKTNYNMARMNLLIHGVEFDRFDLEGGVSTLTAPAHRDDEPFDLIVSNPKWSSSWPGADDAVLINDDRFSPAAVLAPKKYHDLAFTMHSAASLATDGVAVLVQSQGTLYRGHAEQKIREYLVTRNLIETVIQLPPDWGYGVTAPGAIVIIRKFKNDSDILFIDASSECDRVGGKNEVSEKHRGNILEAVRRRESVDHFARRVPNEDVAIESFSLTVNRYVQPVDEHQDVDPKVLNADIASMVSHQHALRQQIDAIVNELEGARA